MSLLGLIALVFVAVAFLANLYEKDRVEFFSDVLAFYFLAIAIIYGNTNIISVSFYLIALSIMIVYHWRFGDYFSSKE